MLSKDLIYALQTRSKKLIRELDGFTCQVEDYSADEGWTVILETMKLVRELGPRQDKYSHTIKAVNRAWLAFAERSDAYAEQLYQYVIDSFEHTNWMEPAEAQRAYQVLYAFHANHLRLMGANAHLGHGLRQYSPRILALVRKLLPLAARPLFAVPIKPQEGIGADALCMLLELYFYHADSSSDAAIRTEAADMLPQLVSAYPHAGGIITLALLRHHPERAALTCQLIDTYIAGAPDTLGGMFYDIMLELVDNDGGSFIYEDLDRITAGLAGPSQRWSAMQFDTFARYAFFYRLKSDEDRRLFLAKSGKARRLARMIVDSGHAGTHLDALRSLLDLPAASQQEAPAGPPQFADLNFKLLVIQTLMYEQEKLLPRFELAEFVRQHTAREIMVEQEGYDVIPEALGYFTALTIPPSLLAEVEELEFDGGLDIYHQVFPFWDGEGDTFDVASVADCALLPNLKRMSCMPDRFVLQHAAALRQRGIAVD